MPNLLYAQSGGVTATINATASAVIASVRRHPDRIGRVYAARNGIIGVLRERLIDTRHESDEAIAALAHTPGGAFGSCRFKLKSLEQDRAHYQRLIDVLRAHDIRYFLYNGGNDSADTSLKISQIATQLGHELHCIGVPKTIDNDLAETDVCPGFGSVAKYVAVSTREASLDVLSMAESSTRVFVLEVMGRHAGWIAAAAGLAGRKDGDPPHIILFPEVVFDEARFLAAVKDAVERHGYCTIIASEGVRGPDGKFLAEAGTRDAFGHVQLGGVGPLIADKVRAAHGYKYHWAVADYLQRSARHIASRTDLTISRKVGAAAVELALAGQNAVMPVVRRLSDRPYRYAIEPAPLSAIANRERKLPANYIRADGFGITAAARRYLEPLIAGEAYPPYVDGLPDYVRLKNRAVKPRLPAYEV
ncbi:MAG: 6-phosphofructokinase [Xanthomonadales bacterium PRO6]|nr:6-phosphofructokinase [Xanthomonadales bacterium PRO6]